MFKLFQAIKSLIFKEKTDFFSYQTITNGDIVRIMNELPLASLLALRSVNRRTRYLSTYTDLWNQPEPGYLSNRISALGHLNDFQSSYPQEIEQLENAFKAGNPAKIVLMGNPNVKGEFFRKLSLRDLPNNTHLVQTLTIQDPHQPIVHNFNFFIVDVSFFILNSNGIRMSFIDTPSQERFRPFRKEDFKRANIILAFAESDAEMQQLKDQISTLSQETDKNPLVFFAGPGLTDQNAPDCIHPFSAINADQADAKAIIGDIARRIKAAQPSSIEEIPTSNHRPR